MPALPLSCGREEKMVSGKTWTSKDLVTGSASELRGQREESQTWVQEEQRWRGKEKPSEKD